MNLLPFSLRLAQPADLPALQAALAYAIDWRASGISAEAPAELIARSGHAYLLADWGRPGDMAVLAEVAGRAAGAAWYRFWTDELHSYGYLDPATPEIGLGVHPEHRRRGIGLALMHALLAQAAAQAVRTVSLSVERDNPAALLYQKLGFIHQADVENSATLLKYLAPPGAS
jgi:ribosomal protein S18 acetylase RimI-like enzyme